MEVAQLHLRHLVGGRARSYMGSVPDERIYQIIFPEKSGALIRFLDAISPTWNVTLFHYRSTGNRESSVLLGVQVRGVWSLISLRRRAARFGAHRALTLRRVDGCSTHHQELYSSGGVGSCCEMIWVL